LSKNVLIATASFNTALHPPCSIRAWSGKIPNLEIRPSQKRGLKRGSWRFIGALLTGTKAEDKLVVRFGRLKLDVVFQLIPKHDSEGDVMATVSQSAHRDRSSTSRYFENALRRKIVGRRGGLSSILTEVEAVAPTNATVLISVSWVVCGSSGETRLETHHTILQDETARYHATCRPLARLNSSRARSEGLAIGD